MPLAPAGALLLQPRPPRRRRLRPLGRKASRAAGERRKHGLGESGSASGCGPATVPRQARAGSVGAS
eukprot:11224713-Lingulodinium_polyedra.AAC.1